MLASIDYLWIDSTIDEPGINSSKTIVAIRWIAAVMVLPESSSEFYIPVIGRTIKASIIIVCSESLSLSDSIVPSSPSRTNTRYIYILRNGYICVEYWGWSYFYGRDLWWMLDNEWVILIRLRSYS